MANNDNSETVSEELSLILMYLTRFRERKEHTWKGGSIMPGAALLPFATWQNFYVLVGTAAATLTGLMFVAITLISQLRVRLPSPSSGISVFSTPNVFHFGAALLVAAILSAPWPALWPASLLLGLLGLVGVIYILIVLWLARHRLAGYQLVLEDWLWYTTLPLVSYTALFGAALMLPGQPALAMFIIASATLLLLFIGIHNAWDLVTYTAFIRPQQEKTSQD